MRVVGDPVEGIIIITQIDKHRRKGIRLECNVWQNTTSITYLTTSTCMVHLGQAIGKYRRTLTLTKGLIVDALYASSTWDVVFGCGELQCTIVGQ